MGIVTNRDSVRSRWANHVFTPPGAYRHSLFPDSLPLWLPVCFEWTSRQCHEVACRRSACRPGLFQSPFLLGLRCTKGCSPAASLATTVSINFARLVAD